jgi:23S rRNA (pseudouridine1915-N3)-methyltransferase
MLRVNIICVGNLKEKYLKDGCAEYLKRLSAFCKPQVVELKEEKAPGEKEGEIARSLEKEGQQMLPYLEGAYNIALCIEGKQMPSEKLADQLEEVALRGFSKVNFIIGGSYGIWQKVKDQCQMRLSMSQMTFPHQLARMMVLEQLYRAFTIQNNIKYHK